MRLSTKIAYNTIIQVVSKVISTILGLVVLAIMTRSLGQAGFGQYTTIFTFLSFFGIMADMGITLVTSQMISVPGANEEKIMNNLLTWRFVTALIFLGVGPYLIYLFPYDVSIKIGVLVSSWSFFFSSMNQVFVGLFQKHLRMDKVSIAEIVSKFVLVAGVIIAVKYNYGLNGMLWATVIASFVSFIIHYIFSAKFVRLHFEFDKVMWKNIFTNSWPIAVTIIFNLIYLKADTLILSLIKSEEEVGIYGAAYKALDVLITIPFMFAGIILPIISASWMSGDKEKFIKIMQKSIDMMIIVALPLMVGTQFFARDIMTLVAGNDFTVSGPVLQILIIACGSIFIGCMFSHAVIAVNKQKAIIKAYVFTSITALIGYLYFIPTYSYMGAAWMTVYSEVVIAIAAGWLVYKETKFFPGLGVFIRSIGAVVVMSFFILTCFALGINIWLVAVVATVVYFVSLYFLGGITKNDMMDLMNK